MKKKGDWDEEAMAIEKVKELYKRNSRSPLDAFATPLGKEYRFLLIKFPRLPKPLKELIWQSRRLKGTGHNIQKEYAKMAHPSCCSHPRDILILPNSQVLEPGKVKAWRLKEYLVGCRSLKKTSPGAAAALSEHQIKSMQKEKKEEASANYSSVERKEERQFQISRL